MVGGREGGTDDQYQELKEMLRGNSRVALCGEKNDPSLLHTRRKNDSNTIRDLNYKAKTVKFLEEIIAEYLCDLVVGKDFIEYKKHKPYKKKMIN